MVAVQQLNSPVVQLIMSISLSIVMFIALRPQILGDTSAGEFVAYITAAGMLARPIKALTDINEKFNVVWPQHIQYLNYWICLRKKYRDVD